MNGVRIILRSMLLTQDEKSVLVWHAIGKGRWYTVDLCKKTNLLAGDIYSALYVMEHLGIVKSEWIEGPYPRRRLYWRTDR